MQYSRSNPSPRYIALIAMYRHMHEHGTENLSLSPEKTFSGVSLVRQITRIKAVVDRTRAKTVLDYGSGKGAYYQGCPFTVKGVGRFDSVLDYWDVHSVACYDPAYGPFSALPQEKFDGVISTDVMEHCPGEDIPWIVDEIFSFARRFVFVNVACYPAEKNLPDGQNAHCTIMPPDWWAQTYRTVARAHPGVAWELWAAQLDSGRPTRVIESRFAG